MANKTKSYKVGPGELQLGDTGDEVDLAPQCSKAKISWDKDTEDAIDTLDGGELPGDVKYKAKLEATVIQDISAGGLVELTWSKKGTQIPFTYTPNSDEEATITGDLVLDPIDVGGDVKTRPTSDIEFDCVGEPAFKAGSSGGDE